MNVKRTIDVGISGAYDAINETASVAIPKPIAFTADTINVYVFPIVNPETV